MPPVPTSGPCRAGRRSGFLARRTVHVHPTRRCNLACLHCYSSSGPKAATGLGAPAILEGLEALRGEGYEVVSLSGGEPFLFREIDALTDGIKRLGFRLTAITNGSALSGCAFLDRFDGVAISLDGLEETHNRMRSNPKAFTWAMQGLDALKRAGTPAALAVCVTRASLRELPAIADFALGAGLSAVQLRPLVLTGRATATAADFALSNDDLNTLAVTVMALAQEYEGRMPIHLDVAGSPAIVASRSLFAPLTLPSHRQATLSDLVNPLVITDEGALQPFTYDFPPEFQIGHLGAGLRAVVEEYKACSSHRLAKVVSEAFRRLEGSADFVDWYAHVASVAASPTSAPSGIKPRVRAMGASAGL